jgi:hypothetical protein
MIPRKHLKTCQVTVGWTIWKWLHNPNIRVGIGCANEALAKDILSEIQMHISQNPKFIELWGNWEVKGQWTKDAFNIKPKTKVSKDKSCEVFSVGKDPTGKHFDVIILDDVANRANSQSADMREKQINLYKDCKNLIVNDETRGIILLVGTRWHFGDIYNYILSNKKILKGFDFVVDKAAMYNPKIVEKFGDKWRQQIKLLLEDPETRVIFPQKFDLAYYRQEYEEQKTFEFSCQMMNYPTSDETAAFKAEDIRIIPYSDCPGGLIKYQLVDCAGIDSTYERADDWAIVTAGIGVDPNIYVLGCVAESKLSMERAFGLLEKEYIKYFPFRVAVEKDILRTNIYTIRTRYPNWKILELKAPTDKSKGQRILALQPFAENHKLVIVEDEVGEEYSFMGRTYKLSPGKIKLLNQIVDYGNMEHDDCIDALAYILLVMKPSKPRTSQVYNYTPENKTTGY